MPHAGKLQCTYECKTYNPNWPCSGHTMPEYQYFFVHETQPGSCSGLLPVHSQSCGDIYIKTWTQGLSFPETNLCQWLTIAIGRLSHIESNPIIFVHTYHQLNPQWCHQNRRAGRRTSESEEGQRKTWRRQRADTGPIQEKIIRSKKARKRKKPKQSRMNIKSEILSMYCQYQPGCPSSKCPGWSEIGTTDSPVILARFGFLHKIVREDLLHTILIRVLLRFYC